MQVIAERFEIDRLAGAGGMGVVYRAIDRHTGQPVAVKMLSRLDAASAERFDKEARILAELDHPRIVRYVAHGRTAVGQYIAMEWLDGETLAERLLRGRLEIRETVALMEAAAGALALVHARGVVHRDIKPSNLFLVAGSLSGLKILDFGIARQGPFMTGTRTGALVGTPGYVAPEQAQGARGVDARADVFALGAVGFECLTGRPAFVAGNIMALLAKILLEEAPRVRELRDDVPAALDALVARLLAKDPALRPAGGAEVAALLRALDEDDVPTPSAGPSAITAGEQRLLSVILATLARDRGSIAPSSKSSTEALGGWADDPVPIERDPWNRTHPLDEDDVPTRDAEPVPERSAALAETDLPEEDRHWPLRAAADEHGGSLEELADGSLVITLKGSGAATDQAARAARCALALRALLPGAPIALATGRGMVALRFPVGEAIDDAARLLRQVIDEERAGTRARPQAVRIDETTAGLLDSRFEVGGDRRGLELVGEHAEVDATRTLLGRKSPFVGREREIGFLEAIFDECVGEPLARPVLITAPPGAGKSRLAQEFRARLTPAEVWIARGDPTRAGSPFAMLAQALRRATGILDGEPAPIRQHKLRARVARHVARADAQRVTELLGELIGTPFLDDESQELRSARRDPMVMGEQKRRAWEELVAATAAAGPLVLVLEDLQWGDLPSIKLVDAALRHASDRPFMVLALARPEVHQLFPQLWVERGLQELRLGELTRRSSERLVRAVLGDVADETVARLCDRAAGNALYLEELIRATAERRSDLPATVLAMMAARLEELEPEARRVLRAASIFGQGFWRGGVSALLGGDPRGVGEWLSLLVDREVVLRRPARRFPGEDEFHFRHALMREAAYALLTDADRALGHRLAAEWLAQRGEPDAVTLAEHFQKGGNAERASAFFLVAAEQALEGNDFAAALARVSLGLAGADDERCGRLLTVAADAQNWQGEFAGAEEAATTAMGLLTRGTPAWCLAVGQLSIACARRGNVGRLVELVDDIRALVAAGAAGPTRDALLQASARVANHLIFAGRMDLGGGILDEIAPLAAAAPLDPMVQGMIHGARAARAMYGGDPSTSYQHSRDAAACFIAAGSLRMSLVHSGNAAFACMEAGADVEAEAALRDVLATARRLGVPNVVASAQHNLGLVLLRRGQRDEAVGILRDAVAALVAQGDRRLEGSARTYLAFALGAAGDDEAAAAEAERAVALLEVAPPLRALALAALAEIRLRQGRVADARAAAAEAAAALDAIELEEGESLVRLVDALTLDAVGATQAARAALAAAAARVAQRADRIAGDWRRRFLALPENARTLELARAWSVAEPA